MPVIDRLEQLERFEQLEPTASAVYHGARVCICLVLLVSCCICHLNCLIIIRCAEKQLSQMPQK
jgi:hypothetical protein